MNPEIKAQWVAALRSGEYRKGTGALRDSDDNFCCLGVLCDLAAKAGVGEWSGSGPVRLGAIRFKGQGDLEWERDTLPLSVQAWSGLGRSNPVATIETGEGVPLAELNDNGAQFARLADLIEESL